MVDLSRRAERDRARELMYFGFKRLVAAPDAVIAARGLSRMHHRLLYFVARDPGLSVGDLLAALDITKQAAHAPLAALLRHRLIRAEPDGRDRRVRRLRLTPRGAALEARLTGLQHRHLARIFERTGPAAARGWRAVMTEMRRE
jgi:DNA-binding MarR family transcriptional regulator